MATLITDDLKRLNDEKLAEASGLDFCKQCGSVGTIVTMGKCCIVRDLDIDAPRERWWF